MKTDTDTSAQAAQIAATQTDASTDGRALGWLSIAVGAAAAVVHPMVAIAGFFLALMGLTVAAPSQRIWSILGVAASVAGFAIGKLVGFSLL